MKALFIFALLAIAYEASNAMDMYHGLGIQDNVERLFDDKLDKEWANFKLKHNKVYENSGIEAQRRYIWENNLQFINKHNEQFKLGKKTFSVNMNKFGDMTNQEFVALYNGYKRIPTSRSVNKQFKISTKDIPDQIDWRKEGYVTEVKDQGQCGSCWAFSAIASLEGQNFNKTKNLVSLSEQNLVDCSKSFGNQGCDGGIMDQAFQYIQANKGVDTEKSYPYKAYDQKCKFNPANVGATVSGFVDITSGDEDALTNAIATVGPIAVAIDASQDSFQFYESGIYYESACSSTELDHGVTAVGYGFEGKTKKAYYYIVKNSWGEGWGDGGYIKMARNDKNMCGIATQASYPLV